MKHSRHHVVLGISYLMIFIVLANVGGGTTSSDCSGYTCCSGECFYDKLLPDGTCSLGQCRARASSKKADEVVKIEDSAKEIRQRAGVHGGDWKDGAFTENERMAGGTTSSDCSGYTCCSGECFYDKLLPDGTCSLGQCRARASSKKPGEVQIDERGARGVDIIVGKRDREMERDFAENKLARERELEVREFQSKAEAVLLEKNILERERESELQKRESDDGMKMGVEEDPGVTFESNDLVRYHRNFPLLTFELLLQVLSAVLSLAVLIAVWYFSIMERKGEDEAKRLEKKAVQDNEALDADEKTVALRLKKTLEDKHLEYSSKYNVSPTDEMSEVLAAANTTLLRFDDSGAISAPPPNGPDGPPPGAGACADDPPPASLCNPGVENPDDDDAGIAEAIRVADEDAARRDVEVNNELIPREKRIRKGASLNLGEKLGSGGFGAVFEGQWMGEKVAVKIAHEKKSNLTKEDLWSAVHEIEIMAALSHTHVVALRGACLESPCIRIAMEYCAGGSLQDRIFPRKGTPVFDLKERIDFAKQAFCGLYYLHKNGIVHRDIKPGNLMLSGTRPDVVKVADFGLSRRISATSGNVHTDARPKGTPNYVAPEIFQAEIDAKEKLSNVSQVAEAEVEEYLADARKAAFTISSDVYSMTNVLYDLFTTTGKSAMTDLGMRRADIADGEHPNPDDLHDDLPSEIREMMDRCWSVDPSARDSAKACMDTLEKARVR